MLSCPACGRAGVHLGARCPCGDGVWVRPVLADPLVGRVLDGRFGVLGRVGAGGAAIVYRARVLDPPGRGAGAAPTDIALKLLRTGADARLRARFHREVLALSTLRGPHLAPLFGAGELRLPGGASQPYLAQGFVEGRPLTALLGGGRLPPARAVAIADAVLRALGQAHAAGVVHRDLSPANVIVAPGGGVTVVDFGLAHLQHDGAAAVAALTTTGTFTGTPHYMAPEQIDHRHPIGPATDLYALGILLYEMLAGTRPFDGLDPLTVLRAQLREPPRPLPRDLAARFGPVVGRALAKAPADRWPSAAAMRRALGDAPAPRRWWRRFSGR